MRSSEFRIFGEKNADKDTVHTIQFSLSEQHDIHSFT